MGGGHLVRRAVIAVVARWMPEKTPLEALIAASVRAEADPDHGPIGPGHVCKHGVRWPHPCDDCDVWPPRLAPITPAPIPASLQLGRSRHPAAIAAQERRRIARLAQCTREANEAARRRAHRLALEASMKGEG